MGRLIIKPARDADESVEWSTIVEAPTTWGTRAQMLEYLTSQPNHTAEKAAQRLDRADETGSSAAGPTPYSSAPYTEGWWDDTELIFEQRGLLKRSDLWKACGLLGEKRDAEVWDLLTPFEDEPEVRRG